MATQTDGYRPGYCNIGDRQRRSRLTVSLAGFGLSLALIAAVLLGFLPRELLVGVFVPLAIGFEWGLQAYTAFCVKLAFVNRYDFGIGTSGRVADLQAQQDDQLQAVKITLAALLLAAVTTAVVVVALG